MRRLLLFAKRPRLGKVKTRLCPPLEAQQALALYRGFLIDLIELLRRCGRDHRAEIWWAGREDAAALDGLDLEGVLQREQPSGDLGQRLTYAFAEHRCPTVVIGADSPTLGGAAISRAFETLSELRPVVLMPSVDGGYVLLGLWKPVPRLFESVSWSSPHVAAETLDRAREAGLRVELLPAGYDVDDASGLRRLEADLARPEIAARAPATLRALRLLF